MKYGYVEFFNFNFLVKTTYTILNSVLVENGNLRYKLLVYFGLNGTSCFRKTSQVDRPDPLIVVAVYDRSVTHFDGRPTGRAGASHRARSTKRPLFIIFSNFIMFWAFILWFCILPLYCVLNYPKRRVLWEVTVESASKIHLPIVYGWQFRIFQDGFDYIWLPDFHRAIKNIPSPSLRIQRLFAVNKSATFH